MERQAGSGSSDRSRRFARVVGNRAITSLRPTTLASWQLSGGPGGRQPAARFRTDLEDSKVVGDWSWVENPFVETQPYRGLDRREYHPEQLGLEDNQQQNLSRDGRRRATLRRARSGSVARQDFGVAALWVLPIPVRGFGQGSRNDIDGFESQGFIKRVDKERVDFDFQTMYGSVVDACARRT